MADEDEREDEGENKEQSEKASSTGGWGLTIFSILLFIGVAFGIVFHLPWWVVVVLCLAWGATLILAIWMEWAPKDFNVGFNEEGTILAIVQGGESCGFLLRQNGRHLAREAEVAPNGPALRKWDVIDDTYPVEKSLWRTLFGGLVWFGPFPFRQLMEKEFEWDNFHSDGKLHHHKETIRAFLSQWDVYGVPITKIEDKNRMPLEIMLTMPMRIINPYEALFEVRTWLPMVMSVILSPLRRFISKHTYDELLSMGVATSEKPLASESSELSDLRNELWTDILNELEGRKNDRFDTVEKLGESLIRFYGIEIDRKRAGFVRLDPDDAWRKTTMKIYVAEQEGRATEITGAAEGAAIAARIKRIGEVVLTLAKHSAGLDNISEENLTDLQRQSVANKFDSAYQLFLTTEAIKTMEGNKGKMLITGSASSMGTDIAGSGKELVTREMVRKFVGGQFNNELDIKEEDKLTDKEEINEETKEE